MNYMMNSEFSTFGSGASMLILNRNLNEKLNENFTSNYSIEVVSLISLMSEPIVFDENLINSAYDYDNVCVKQDLTKDFLDFLENDNKVEYLIIDTYNDVEFRPIKVNGSYITGSNRLKKVDYYNDVKDMPHMDIHKDFDEYFEVWKDSCDRFFKFLSEKRPDVRIILNMARLCFRYMKDGKIVEDESLKRKSKDNKLRDALDCYIIENYDVEVLRFGEDILLDKDHIFGLYSTSYEQSYYTEKNQQLNWIIEKNRLYDYNSPVNRKLRQIDRKDALFDIKIKKINED